MHSDEPDRREFDNYAPDYQQLLSDPIRERFAGDQGFFHRRKLQVLLALLKQLNVDSTRYSWLDVGCGQGDLLTLGAPLFSSASGCDPSADMIRSSTLVNVKLQDDLDRLPFPDASFDLVTAVCVYHHVETAKRIALGDEIRRVLRPGGLFGIFEHNPWNPATRIVVSRCPVDRNAELLTRGEAVSLLGRSGFHAVASRFFLYLPEPLFRYVPGVEDALGRLPLGGQYAVLFRCSE